jgi:hypothetical protein
MEKPRSITVRITNRQRNMLDSMTREWEGSLSDVVRDILDREMKRRRRARWPDPSMAPTRRP